MRDSYRPEERVAHAVASRCSADLGLAIARNAAANTTQPLPGRDRGLPPILIGSHLDTAAHGGNLDGAAGGDGRPHHRQRHRAPQPVSTRAGAQARSHGRDRHAPERSDHAALPALHRHDRYRAESEAISALQPDYDGGNMDLSDVRVDAAIYLPINAKGAILYLGECLAAQGDGELCGVGVQHPTHAMVQIDLIQDRMPCPHSSWFKLSNSATSPCLSAEYAGPVSLDT
ncbi:acetamidase/formamidase family protein [Methylobacterium sp. E-005]|nr:acetamidase/formamidase family protein [Methylobacterium sp. E-005]MCJ2090780.1 acetamidase/formamidase family protein [Methylobacterium sp. E-005]